MSIHRYHLSNSSSVILSLGTPASAGFGLVGLVGPLASLDAGLSIILLLISWFVVPIVAAFVGQILFEKILKLYDRKDVLNF